MLANAPRAAGAALPIKSIQSSKSITLDRFIYARGILHVGAQTARDLTGMFHNLDELMHAFPESFREVDGVGDKVAQSIFKFFQDKSNLALAKKLLKQGLLR